MDTPKIFGILIPLLNVTLMIILWFLLSKSKKLKQETIARIVGFLAPWGLMSYVIYIDIVNRTFEINLYIVFLAGSIFLAFFSPYYYKKNHVRLSAIREESNKKKRKKTT